MSRTYEQEYQIDMAPLQGLTGAINVDEWLVPIERLARANDNVPDLYFNQEYTHEAGDTVISQSSVYCPINDRIYLFWYYVSGATGAGYFIDCHTRKVESYVVEAGDMAIGYLGCAYFPGTSIIAMVPGGEGVATESNTNYLDVSDNTLHSMGGTFTMVQYPYAGGVYSPTQERLYCVPYGQADESNWHYIDSGGKSITAYAHGLTTFACQNNAYYGGVYSPTQNRIYFVPYGQSDETFWHFIDCDDGTVYAYYHGATVVANGYRGGAYSPTQNRIYFAPYGQSNAISELWHYIDCDDGTVGTYAAPDLHQKYTGAVYSPVSNKIFFIPYEQNTLGYQAFIDCSSGLAGQFEVSALGDEGYHGGCFDPINGRVYYNPFSNGSDNEWHYIQEMGIKTGLARHMFGSTIISSTM
jgi:hypothetical protein